MILKKICCQLYLWLGKLHITKPVVMVMVDGGLCSQMHQLMMGEILKEKGHTVEYDLSFFKTGLDLNNLANRPFLINKVFPNYSFRKASSLKVNIYKRLFINCGKYPAEVDKSWLNKSAPVLLHGYYSDIPEMYDKGGLFARLWKLDAGILSERNRKVLGLIESTNSVGIHVRRGDLSTYNSVYGNPVSIDYLIKGIEHFLAEREKPMFFFFSDDTQYVKDVLIPSIKMNISFEVIESEQDRVYEDFILLSFCKDLITSKGTMGKYAALYGNAKTVVLANDDRQKFIVESLPCKKVII